MFVWHVTTEIMLVIICLLEDEQELSLGMLIRPKRIYNFCLLHACFVGLCHVLLELLYTFGPIWTNILTQCTQLPVPVFCCFCISGFPIIKVPNKSRKNYIKNQRSGSFRNNQDTVGGPPPASQEGAWRGPALGRATCPPECHVAPLGAPFGPYFYPRGGNPDSRPLFARSNSDLRRHRKQVSGGQNSYSGTPPGRGSAPGFISIDVASLLHEAGVVPPRG